MLPTRQDIINVTGGRDLAQECKYGAYEYCMRLSLSEPKCKWTERNYAV